MCACVRWALAAGVAVLLAGARASPSSCDAGRVDGEGACASSFPLPGTEQVLIQTASVEHSSDLAWETEAVDADDAAGGSGRRRCCRRGSGSARRRTCKYDSVVHHRRRTNACDRPTTTSTTTSTLAAWPCELGKIPIMDDCEGPCNTYQHHLDSADSLGECQSMVAAAASDAVVMVFLPWNGQCVYWTRHPGYWSMSPGAIPENVQWQTGNDGRRSCFPA